MEAFYGPPRRPPEVLEREFTLTASITRVFIWLTLSFPTLALLFLIKDWTWLPVNEWSPVLIFTVTQALWSSMVSLLFGYWSAWSLLKQTRAKRKYLEVFYLLPNLMPVLFVIISTMNVFNLFAELPQGLWGIVTLHGIINTGLVSIALAKSIESRLGSCSDLARVDGASLLQFHLKILLPLLKRDFFLIGFLVFSVCFTSFSIPLIMGGVQGATMEVLIYEKIRSPQGWSAAIYLSLLQILILFSLSLLIGYFKQTENKKAKQKNLQYGSLPFSMVPGILCSLLVVLGQVWKLPEGLRQWNQLELNMKWLWPLLLKSLYIGAGVGGFTFIILGLIVYSSPSKWFQKYLLGYTSPSAALTGLVLYIIAMGEWVEIKLILGISIISLPFCYRFILDSAISSIKEQIHIAKAMGAHHFLIFRNILWPQASPYCGMAAGLGALWACGDFAFSSMVAESEITLALKIKNLLNSYRLEMSILLSWIMLACGGILFLCFGGLGRVLSRKFIY